MTAPVYVHYCISTPSIPGAYETYKLGFTADTARLIYLLLPPLLILKFIAATTTTPSTPTTPPPPPVQSMHICTVVLLILEPPPFSELRSGITEEALLPPRHYACLPKVFYQEQFGICLLFPRGSPLVARVSERASSDADHLFMLYILLRHPSVANNPDVA